MKVNFNSQSSKYESLFEVRLNEMITGGIAGRIWKKDHTVWRNDPAEISNRLDWLDSPAQTLDRLEEITSFVDEIRSEGFTHAILLGMGGSSLAPEVFRLTFGVEPGYLDLGILDSTDPGEILNREEKLAGRKILYIVSTKSGGTVETISLMKYFYTRISREKGAEDAGKYFMAITDPGSGLESIAKELKFRKVFLNNPDIGGRYSALSLFGMVPAALMGIRIDELLSRTLNALESTKLNSKANTALTLGALMGFLAEQGRDKLTLIFDDKLKYLGSWIEQLVAESTGKDGTGILPVDFEDLCEPEYYSNDRLFVSIQLKGSNGGVDGLSEFIKLGHPAVEIELNDLYDIASEFFRWEFATAVAGYVLNIQPFDQPNVESAKVQARKMLAVYKQTGKLPEITWDHESDGLKIYSSIGGDTAEELFAGFFAGLDPARSEDYPIPYLGIQAYLTPDASIFSAFQRIRQKIHKKYKIATTFGYGPRFLHSTGQLHKGDAGKGIFLQVLDDINRDLPIPDVAGEEVSTVSFGVLRDSQALGDRQALVENNRRVVTVNLGSDPLRGIDRIGEMI